MGTENNVVVKFGWVVELSNWVQMTTKFWNMTVGRMVSTNTKCKQDK